MAAVFNVIRNGVTYDIYTTHSVQHSGTPTTTARFIAGENVVTTPQNPAYIRIAQVVQRYTPAVNTDYYGTLNHTEITPTANGAYKVFGHTSVSEKTGAFDNTSSIYGYYSMPLNSGDGSMGTMYGMYAFLYDTGTGVVGNANGFYTLIYPLAGATISAGRGLYVSYLGNGTVGKAYGVEILDVPDTVLHSSSALLILGGVAATEPTNRWSIYNFSPNPNIHHGPQIDVAVKKCDDFTELTWGATGVWAVGQKWRSTIAAGGSVTLLSPARGGIVTLFAPVLAGPNSPTFLDENNILGWSLQDRPVLYTRWRVVEDAEIRAAVGWTDDVAEGIADPMPYTDDAVLVMVDTAVGAFYYLVGVRAGVRTNVSSAVALSTVHRYFMILPKYTSAGAFDGVELFEGGQVRCSLTAAQCPVETTMMQCLSGYVQNLAAGAADKHQRVDKADFGVLTNTGAGDT